MSIYIVMHHAHTAQRGRETFRFAHTCRKIKISTYIYVYMYIYVYARMYMKVHKFATRHSQPERGTDCGKLFAK